MFDYLRFRGRRSSRRLRRDTRILRIWAGNYIRRHIINKWHQLGVVRRFLFIWLGVLAVAGLGVWQQVNYLAAANLIQVPMAGGIYTEAAVGTVKALNPVLPESSVSADINRLIFSGLTRYNPQRKLVGDLAESWNVSADGRTYTFRLRHGVKWHDGVPFTSADVAFTITAIQTPDTRSPLASSWQDVRTTIKDDYTIAFTLPTPLNSFMDSTTIGIVPRHLLESVEPSQLRENAFNQHPIGTGPFKLKTFAPSAREIALDANPDYYAGRPQLDQFVFKLFDSADDVLSAYAQRQVTSPGRLEPNQEATADKLSDLYTYDSTLPEEMVLFFNNNDPTLKNKSVRQALSQSLNRGQILAAAGGQGQPVSQPLLPGQIGYTTKYALASEPAAAAKKALEQAGVGKTPQFTLVTLDNDELKDAAAEIKRQYAAIGVTVKVNLVSLDSLQQSYMRPRNFQMLLFGINVGADPDVYTYWHSSQAKDPGVNLSGYSSDAADVALEAGRIKADSDIRRAKYDAFLKAWDDDAPAVVLYQSIYRYAVRDTVSGPQPGRLGVASDRFWRVERWTVLRRPVPVGFK